MALSNAQFSKLNAMGIQIWQQRKLSNSPEKVDQCIDITVDDYQQSQLISDACCLLNLAKTQLNITPKGIDCGEFYWCFHTDNQCQYWPDKALLITPSLQQLIANSSTKKQLWLQLQQISHEY